jgi:hypothetical protein
MCGVMCVGENFQFSVRGRIGLLQAVSARHAGVKVCFGQTDIGVAIVEMLIMQIMETITHVNDVVRHQIELMRILNNIIPMAKDYK